MQKWLLGSLGVLVLLVIIGAYMFYNSILLAEVYGEKITRWQTVEASWELMTPLGDKEKEKAINLLIQKVIDQKVFWEILKEVPFALISELTGKEVGDRQEVEDDEIQKWINRYERHIERAERMFKEGEYDTDQYRIMKEDSQKRIKEHQESLDTPRKFEHEEEIRALLISGILRGELVLYEFLSEYYEVERSKPEEAVYKMIREGIESEDIRIYEVRVQKTLEQKMEKDELISPISLFSNKRYQRMYQR